MTPRKSLARFGYRGALVRVFVERGGELVRVQWKEGSLLKTKSWDNTPDNRAAAKAWGKAFTEARTAPRSAAPVSITLREMWEKYSLAEFPHLRPKTQRNYKERWMDWERFAGRGFVADLTTLEMMDQYRAERTKLKYSVTQTGEYVKIVKQVYAWALRRELITRNRLALYRYKVAKEERAEAPEEYKPDEFPKILAQLDPRDSREWRAWAAIVLCGTQGPRSNAALHLRWDDVDFEKRTICWRAAYDKVGRERIQPLTVSAIEALHVALGWGQRDSDASGWVFYSPQTRKHDRGDGTYSIQALWQMLKNAEDAAGITRRSRRAMHGFRRMAAGNALDLTGNIADAMWWIGDTDLRQGKRYLKERDTRMRELADNLGTSIVANETVTKAQPITETTKAPITDERPSVDTTTTYNQQEEEPQVGIEPTTARLLRECN